MDFVLTDNTVDSYGERIIASGIKLDRFLKNPIMLYMHDYYGWRDNSVIGRWTDVRIEGDALIATAEFAQDEFSQEIAQKVEQGVLNAVSVGIRVLEATYDDMVEGQDGATITRSEIFEASIVIIPANENAIAIRGDMQDKAKNKSYSRYLYDSKTSDPKANGVTRHKSYKSIKSFENSKNQKAKMFTEKEKNELEAKIKQLETDLQASKDFASQETEKVAKAQNELNTHKAKIVNLTKSLETLGEQNTALETLRANGESTQETLEKTMQELEILKKEKAGLELEIKQIKEESLGELEILKGCMGLSFPSEVVKDAFVTSWKSVHNVQKNEETGTWQVFSKATQEILEGKTIAQSLKEYAVSSGFAKVQKGGLGLGGNEGIQSDDEADAGEISYKDAYSKDSVRKELHAKKYSTLHSEAISKGMVANGKDYTLFMHSHGMVSPTNAYVLQFEEQQSKSK